MVVTWRLDVVDGGDVAYAGVVGADGRCWC